MKTQDINLMQLEAVASALGDLLPQVTFVGGSTTVLLVARQHIMVCAKLTMWM